MLLEIDEQSEQPTLSLQSIGRTSSDFFSARAADALQGQEKALLSLPIASMPPMYKVFFRVRH